MSTKYQWIEASYGKDWKTILQDFHLKCRMSSYEISEKILADTGIDYSYRQVQRWLDKFGILRHRAEALKNRVMTGRMDYAKRKLDYEGRFIDYDARDRTRNYLWAVGLSKLLPSFEDIIRLAKALGCSREMIYLWKNLRHRVSSEYQDRICSYFGLDRLMIFSDKKTFDVPKKQIKCNTNGKKRLMANGYRYATHLQDIMYQKDISISDLAEKLNKPYPSISRWIRGLHLVSPTDQARVERILKVSADRIFSPRP